MVSMEDKDRQKDHLIGDWHTLFKKGTDFDLWGQPLEAADAYQLLATRLRKFADPKESLFPDDKKKILSKIASCLEMRSKALQRPAKMEGISLEDMKKVGESLKSLLSNEIQEFPLAVSGIPMTAGRSPTTPNSHTLPIMQEPDRLSEEEKEENALVQKSQGSLLPPPVGHPGDTLVTVRIEKIGLKDASQYIDPFITVAIKDDLGKPITSSQDTPLAVHKEDQQIVFGVDVYLQKPLEVLPPGYGLFFEFKHYKPKKRMISTKCWAFMEKDEVQEGPAVLELYKKPPDYKRKRISLMTVKPLYLHVKLTFN